MVAVAANSVEMGATPRSVGLLPRPVVAVADVTVRMAKMVARAVVAVVIVRSIAVGQALRAKASLEGAMIIQRGVRVAAAAEPEEPVRHHRQGALAGQALRPR
jgi:hypothetical protein